MLSYHLVHWLADKTYSIVPDSQVKGSNEQGCVTDVEYGDKTFKAIIVKTSRK